jgi:uncharacterized membrane protein YidH (DUF202 family)
MPSPEDDDAPGFARERTGLAWERSALAFGALGAVVLGVAAHRDEPALLAVSAALAVAGGVIWHHGRRSYDRPAVAPQTQAFMLMTLAAAVVAVIAAIVVVVTR